MCKKKIIRFQEREYRKYISLVYMYQHTRSIQVLPKQNLFGVAQLRDDLLIFTIDVYRNSTKQRVTIASVYNTCQLFHLVSYP